MSVTPVAGAVAGSAEGNQGARVQFLYEEAFSRNSGLISADEQRALREARVVVAGLGGVGGVHLLALARLGIGRFTIADFDRFALVNMNRQVGATVATLGVPKVEVMADMVRAVNPTAEISSFPDGLTPENADRFFAGAIAAVDGLDFFAMGARRLFFRRARAHGVPAITSAPAGFGATLLVFSPTGMSFDEYFDMREGMPEAEQLLNLVLGLAPRRLHGAYFPAAAVDLAARRVPSVAPGCFVSAGVVATEVANLVLRRRPTRIAPEYFQFDPMVQRYAVGRLRRGNRGLGQRLKKWWVLRSNPEIRALVRGAPTP